ncbi:MAG: hypothetical protein COA99_00890 [Moraxellaceae bacterium]|nr:MAG: hypothetical protein COA99_00890 [Moraxellaceae bacterium]
MIETAVDGVELNNIELNNIELNTVELDMLCEAFNIGAHKSAKALSDLTSHPVTLAIPKVKEIDVTSLYSALTLNVAEDIVCVRLPMSDSIEGHAELVLIQHHADKLASLCIPSNIPEEMLQEARQGMLAEIGNILLNACFGTVANMLNFEVDLSVPTLHYFKKNSMDCGCGPETRALAINTCMTIEGADVEGYIVIYVGNESIVRIKHYLQEFMVNAGINVSAT